MIEADIKRRRDAGELPPLQKSRVAPKQNTALLERYRIVKDAPEYAAIVTACSCCEHFAKGRHCAEAVRTCGCAAGSVLGMVVKGKACPLDKWQALDVESIVSRGF